MLFAGSYGMLLTCYLSVAFWENTKNPTLLNFLNFRLSAGDLGDKKTEYNRYNNELNTISKHYAEMSEMGQKIAKWKGAFKVDIFFFWITLRLPEYIDYPATLRACSGNVHRACR